ncbi:MAG: outer membrane protein, partial [Longimicrobiales bacterium]
DFSGFAFGGDVGIRATDQLDLVLGAMYGRAGARSDYHDLVDQDDLPIVQDTRLTRVPLTARLRFYLVPRGRAIGSFAWVPSTVVPYLGAGAGAMYHRFEQEGSFVDEFDPELPIYDDVLLQSSGWSPLAQVLGGIEIALGPRIALMTEGRYLWSSADLDLDFEDYEPIDLAGFQATAGLSFRF